MLACSLIGNIWQIKHKRSNEIKENQDFPQSYMSVFSITENHRVPKERMDLPFNFREHGVSVGGRGGSRPRGQKESQVAKAAERDARSTESAGSRDPAAPLPLPQSSNKLPWMLRFLDSFLSLSHISFAPSWQSVRAVTVQLWKSSQYLARNRTNRRSRFTLGAWEDPGPVPVRPALSASPASAGAPSLPPLHCPGAWALRGQPSPDPAHPSSCGPRRGPPRSGSGLSPGCPAGTQQSGSGASPAAPSWHLGLRQQIARPPRGKLGKQC